MRNKVIIGIILLLIIGFAAQTSAYEEPIVPVICPDGTYNIGTEEEPVCKNEPTGCVNGDSIPLEDCDKFNVEKDDLAATMLPGGSNFPSTQRRLDSIKAGTYPEHAQVSEPAEKTPQQALELVSGGK